MGAHDRRDHPDPFRDRRRGTAARKARIRDSRVAATARLAHTLARATPPPRVLVCASAIGYYANRRDEVLIENSPPGTGFLAQVCREWEAATAPATARGIRVVNLRIGLVLSPAGGALAKMLTPFRLGLGGVIGDGAQWMSWIALADLIGAIHHALATEPLHGPVNAVAPTPRSYEFRPSPRASPSAAKWPTSCCSRASA